VFTPLAAWSHARGGRLEDVVDQVVAETVAA
jgi:hypothetical protein